MKPMRTYTAFINGDMIYRLLKINVFNLFLTYTAFINIVQNIVLTYWFLI